MNILDQKFFISNGTIFYSLREIIKEILQDEELSVLLGKAIMNAPVGVTQISIPYDEINTESK